jgi:hypothetical protein
MHKHHYPLWKTLGITCLTFCIAALIIHIGFTPSKLTLLIDRSYCPPSQWQSVVAQYEQIYRQPREVPIQSVLLFSDLGVEVRSTPPPPDEIASLSTYGRANPEQQKQLQQHHQNSRLLTCFP